MDGLSTRSSSFFQSFLPAIVPLIEALTSNFLNVQLAFIERVILQMF